MSYGFYNMLHLGALCALAISIGGLGGISALPAPDKKLKAFLLSLHGLSALFIFFAGFGLIAKLKIPAPWPVWIYLKLVIWLILAAAPFFIRRAGARPKLRVWIFLSALSLILLALFIARLKPHF